MPRVDPLQNAIAAYAADKWADTDWRVFGRETGTSDIIDGHPRLYRSLGFGDDDYPDAAAEVVRQILASEAVEEDSGEAGRMELFADSMPDLPTWTENSAPARTRRLFQDYLDARDASEIPTPWQVESAPEPEADPDAWLTEPSTPNPPYEWPEDAVLDHPAPATQVPSIFIVHGHDEAALNSIRIYVHKVTGLMPISLAEEAGRGQTIIEKFEAIGAEASFVIVLLTPDDVGQANAAFQAKIAPDPRARQNVVLELGYFIGKIGRESVVVVDADVERPSDLAGLSYVQYPGSNWKDSLRTELDAAGLIRTP